MGPVNRRYLLLIPNPCCFCKSINKFRPIFSRPYSIRQLGPESPNYVEVPLPPQPSAVPRRRIRGILPVPRNIFPKGNADNVTQQYISRTTPKRRGDQATGSIRPSQRLLWKRRLAKTRKQNFREGILALKSRALKARDKRQLARRKAGLARATMLNKPESDDEHLTNPTAIGAVRSLLQKNLNQSHTNNQSQILQRKASAERFAKQKVWESKNRIDDIRALYVNATHFITDMSQLKSAVDEAFGSPEKPVTFGKDEGPNIWFEGKPLSIQDRLDLLNSMNTSSVSPSERRARIAEKRLNRIANMLLGKSDELEADDR